MAKLAFLGLGVMGFPMARHLVETGHDVTVYNRTSAKAKKFAAEFKSQMADSPGEAAIGADIVFACVGDDPDIKQITIGERGAFAAMKPNSILVDHTTASAKVARELADAADEKNLYFIDAPVSGGQLGAENGKLTIMCGGQKEIFEKAQPIMACYGAKITWMGPAGSGQLTKMVNQICIAGLLQGLSEALNFGQKAGLEMERALDVIAGGAAQSWQMENRGTTMLANEFDFGFAVDWMRKDLNICIEEAAKNGAELPITAIISQLYGRLSNQGFGRNDTSSLIRLLKER
ncbi:NAD(P)-dependent oxidoreductase [Alphaproteobacteria bacterium]|jgi:3-hydroxyisobutyrate dehydrogenase|nr:NAD(P)-dependent oxidoreductase [Alphaproteobacteria bacterium]MDC0462123.1 NAD(P)-dependent oxidoreductase [Alphaproteobacteria bacterium]